MRPLEWLIVAALLPAILWSIQPQFAAWTGWFAVVAAIAVLLHSCLEGMHWQMGPAYLASGLTLLAAAAGASHPVVRLCCGVLAAVLLAASCAFSWALPMFRLPQPTGSYPVGTRLLHITDPDRPEMHSWAEPGSREIVVQLWYPAATGKGRKAAYRRRRETTFRSSYQAVLPTQSVQDAPLAAGRFPLIVHNPGWHGWRQRGTFMTQELASHGFIVAGVSHPYNSSFVELQDGRVVHPDYGLDIGFSTHHYISLEDRFALADEELAIQTQDCRHLLDELQKMDREPGHPLESHLLMDRVGGYGFSFGGAVSAELAREDSRVRSALELDGVLHGVSAREGLDKPLMMMDSAWMADPLAGHDGWIGRVIDPSISWSAAANSETQTMWNTIAESKAATLARWGGFRVILRGMGHPDFTDTIFMSPLRRLSQAGSVPPKRVSRILNAYVLAFFQQTLLDVPSSLLSADAQPFPEVTFQKWEP